MYPNVHFSEVSSTVDFIRRSYVSSMEMLFEGALLAVIVVWVFLRDWRATLISATALPLAIIPLSASGRISPAGELPGELFFLFGKLRHPVFQVSEKLHVSAYLKVGGAIHSRL